MARRMKVFLPRWILWVILPVLLLMWGFLTYSAFGTASGREELGLVGWAFVTVILLLVGIMMGLMASGRLPAYLIEVEESDESPKR